MDKLSKLEASYKDLIDQENSKDSDLNDSDDVDDDDPLVMDLAEALKPTIKHHLLVSNTSETDSCESGQYGTQGTPDNSNQIMKEKSGGTNMKQLKNYVNFYKVTRDFEQKFKSLKSKNKSKLYFSMSSLSDVKEAINNPQNESGGQLNHTKKWKSESNLNTCVDTEFNVESIRNLLISGNEYKKSDSVEFISESLLPFTTDESFVESEKDPLSVEEDIKPTFSDLIDNSHPKESPKKGLIKLRNITELVDDETSLKRTTKSLNIPVKFDLRSMRVIGQTPASTNVSSISKQYVCYSDKNEGCTNNDDFNPKIEAAFSLAKSDTPKVGNTIQKLNIPYKEIQQNPNPQEKSIHDIYSQKESSISNKTISSDPVKFNVISLNSYSDCGTKKHIILQKPRVSISKSPDKNYCSPLPLSSVSNLQKLSFEGSPSFINILNDSPTSVKKRQKVGIVYPNTLESVYEPKKMFQMKCTPAQSISQQVTFVNSLKNSTITNPKVLHVSSKSNRRSLLPKGNNTLAMKNPTTLDRGTTMPLKNVSVPNNGSETIIGNIKLVKPVNVTSKPVNVTSKPVNNVKEYINHSSVNKNSGSPALALNKLAEKILSTTPVTKMKQNTTPGSSFQNLEPILIKKLEPAQSLQDIDSEPFSNEPPSNPSPSNEKSKPGLNKLLAPEGLLSKKSTIVFTSNQKKEDQTGLSKSHQSIQLVPTSKPTVPSSSTIAKTRLLFRKDIPKKDKYLKTALGAKTCNSMRQYTCIWCDTSFVKKYLLNQHVQRVTCNMVYECIGCSGRRILFRNRCQLLKHLLKHYGSHHQIVINYNKLKIFRLSVKDIFASSIVRKCVASSDQNPHDESLGSGKSMKSESCINKSKKPNSTPTTIAVAPNASVHLPLSQYYKYFQRKKNSEFARKRAIALVTSRKLKESTSISETENNNGLKKTTITLKVPVKKSSTSIQNSNADRKVELKSKAVKEKQADLELKSIRPILHKKSETNVSIESSRKSSANFDLINMLENHRLSKLRNSSTVENCAQNTSEDISKEVRVEESTNREMMQSKRKSRNKDDITLKRSNMEKQKMISVSTNLINQGNGKDKSNENNYNILESNNTIVKEIGIKRKLPEEFSNSEKISSKKTKLNDGDVPIICLNQSSNQEDTCTAHIVCNKSNIEQASSHNKSEELLYETKLLRSIDNKAVLSDDKICSTKNHILHSVLQSTMETKNNANEELNTIENIASDKEGTSTSQHVSEDTFEKSAQKNMSETIRTAQNMDEGSEKRNKDISIETKTSSSHKSQALCFVCKTNPKNVCFNFKNPPNPKYTCATYCLAVMSNLCTLTLHKNLHERKKPFICPACGKEFIMYKDLSSHMTTKCKYRSRIIASKCLYCDYCVDLPPNSKDYPDSMERHFVEEHLVEDTQFESTPGNENYRCKLCLNTLNAGPRSFFDKHLHFKFHFNNKKTLVYRFRCDACKLVFKNRRSLLLHSCEKNEMKN